MNARRFDPVWSAPLLFVVLGLVFLAVPVYKAATRENCVNNKDYTFWWEIGSDVRADLPLYAPMFTGELKYLYPPTLAVLLFAPLTHLGPVGFVLALGTLSALAWPVSIWASLKLLTGRWAGHPRWVYVVPSLAVSTYIWDVQLLGQINLVLLAFVLLSFVALRGQRKIAAGALFGLPVAMKAFPLPAIAYFAVRREWKVVAIALVMTGVYVWLLPGLVRGLGRNTDELTQWTTTMLGDQSGRTVAARSGIGFTRRNHSLASVSHRLLRDVDAGDDPHRRLNVNVANISPRAAQWIGWAACGLLGLALLVATRLRFATSPLAEGLEVSMVCIMVLMVSPLSHTYYYCWLLPAWTAIAVMWNAPELSRTTRRRVRIGGILAGILLASALSEQVDPTLQALGVTTWGSVTLYLTMAYVRWTLPQHERIASAPGELAAAKRFWFPKFAIR